MKKTNKHIPTNKDKRQKKATRVIYTLIQIHELRSRQPLWGEMKYQLARV
jgi:hypothetical protein